MTQESSKPIEPSFERTPARRFGLRSAPLELRMLALAIIIAVALSLLSPYFLKTNNLLNLLDQSVSVGIVSIGMTFVILTGGIDLSVGSVVGLTGVILGLALHHFSIAVAIALATLSGAGIGLFSGLLIAYFDLAAFVITLGVMAIGRSLAYIFSGQTSISDIPPQLNDLVYTEVFGIQTNVLTVLVLYALAWAYLTDTKGGRTIYAVGSNREAARTAGLSVLFYSVLPYVVSGALSAIAATLMSSQILSIDPLAGT
ncbi:MAG TPA: ABC transporter permease, partial [Roseiarcus sp.]